MSKKTLKPSKIKPVGGLYSKLGLVAKNQQKSIPQLDKTMDRERERAYSIFFSIILTLFFHLSKCRYTKMEPCLTPLPEVSDIKETAGGKLPNWPERLTSVPPRISSGSLKQITAQNFTENTELWRKRVAHYKALDNQLAEPGRYRNLLDMNSFLGGFAAALVDYPLWVMNAVPVEADFNTLGVIYERGLIGTYQNW